MCCFDGRAVGKALQLFLQFAASLHASCVVDATCSGCYLAQTPECLCRGLLPEGLQSHAVEQAEGGYTRAGKGGGEGTGGILRLGTDSTLEDEFGGVMCMVRSPNSGQVR